MAPKNKEGGMRLQTRPKPVKINLPDAESSEEDYRKKRDKNNQVYNFLFTDNLSVLF